MYVNRGYPVVLLLLLLDDEVPQAESGFGIALFSCGPAVRGLEPKDQRLCCPLTCG